MDVLGAHSYDTLAELERESYYEKKLRRWLSSFSCGDQAFILQLLRDTTAFFTPCGDQVRVTWHGVA